jgi:hypothetical protein
MSGAAYIPAEARARTIIDRHLADAGRRTGAGAWFRVVAVSRAQGSSPNAWAEPS